MQSLKQSPGENTLIKKLTYISWHRGTREMDLILGRFADEFLADFSSEQLQTYAQMLECSDAEIFDWIRKQHTPPENFRFIINYICCFYNIEN